MKLRPLKRRLHLAKVRERGIIRVKLLELVSTPGTTEFANIAVRGLQLLRRGKCAATSRREALHEVPHLIEPSKTEVLRIPRFISAALLF
jgi:hypothetical protein